MDALSSGGLHQTGKDAVGFESAFRSGSEAYLAEDHQMPERLFCMIVGGRDAGGWCKFRTPDIGTHFCVTWACSLTP